MAGKRLRWFVCRLPGFPGKEAKGSHVRIKSEVHGEPGAPWSPRRPVLSTASSSAGVTQEPGGAAMWTAEGRGQGKAGPG